MPSEIKENFKRNNIPLELAQLIQISYNRNSPLSLDQSEQSFGKFRENPPDQGSNRYKKNPGYLKMPSIFSNQAILGAEVPKSVKNITTKIFHKKRHTFDNTYISKPTSNIQNTDLPSIQDSKTGEITFDSQILDNYDLNHYKFRQRNKENS